MKSSRFPNGPDEGPTPGLVTRELSWKPPNGMAGELVAMGLIILDCMVNEPHWDSTGLWIGVAIRLGLNPFEPPPWEPKYPMLSNWGLEPTWGVC